MSVRQSVGGGVSRGSAALRGRLRATSVRIGAALLSAGSAVAFAHHSTAMFDKKKEVTLVGVVTEYQWTNPHVFIEMDVPGEQGVAHYSIEGGSTRTMEKYGWKVRTLRPGDKLTLTMRPLRDGKPGGLVISAVLADGSTLKYDTN